MAARTEFAGATLAIHQEHVRHFRDQPTRWCGSWGAHVGPRWSHTSARGVQAHTRALVASFAYMGLELNLLQADADEMKIIGRVVAQHKPDRDLWASGLCYRLGNADSNLLGVAVVAADGSRARAVILQSDRPRWSMPAPLPIPGLDPARRYRIELLLRDPAQKRSSRPFDNPLEDEVLVLGRDVLSTAGVQLPILRVQQAIALAMEVLALDG